MNQKIKAKKEVKKITIFSAYSRALWLATELCNKGYEVTYLDHTDVLGGLSPESWDSPFGVFQTKNLSFSQSTWLSEGATLEPQDNGFIFFSTKGPMEFRGPFSKMGFKRYGVSEEQLEYLWQSSTLGREDFLDLNKKINSHSFQNRWFLNYIHQANSSVYYENHLGMSEKNKPLPLNEPWFLRKISRRGSLQAIEMGQGRGVRIENVQEVKSIAKDFKRLKALRWQSVSGETHDEPVDLVLNFLSQEELAASSSNVFGELFGGEPILSDWFWTQFRYSVKSNDVTNILPKAFSLVHHIFLPWTHENHLVIHRGLRKDEFIVWCRAPQHYRIQKNRVEELSVRIEAVLKNHFPTFQVLSRELPSDTLPGEHQTRAPHLPVYNPKTLAKLKSSRFSNFVFFGPEVWERLDLGCLLELEQNILSEVIGTDDSSGISRRRGRDNEIYS